MVQPWMGFSGAAGDPFFGFCFGSRVVIPLMFPKVPQSSLRMGGGTFFILVSRFFAACFSNGFYKFVFIQIVWNHVANVDSFQKKTVDISGECSHPSPPWYVGKRPIRDPTLNQFYLHLGRNNCILGQTIISPHPIASHPWLQPMSHITRAFCNEDFDCLLPELAMSHLFLVEINIPKTW